MSAATVRSPNKTLFQKLGSSRKLRNIGRRWQLILMFLPPLAWYIIFHYVPMYGIQIAFRDFNPRLGFLRSPFVGLRHFERFFSSFYVWQVIWNTLAINIYQVLFAFPAPIILALIINEIRTKFFKKALQNITFVPFFLSVVVTVSMVHMFLNPNFGVVNHFIAWLGFDRIGFMESHRYFRGVFVISGIWENVGFNSIIYIAALAGIDTGLYEAANIDGASRVRKIWHVSLPGILPVIVTLFIMRMGSMLSVGFERAFLMQNPLNMQHSDVIQTLVFRTGILDGNFGYAAAVGLMNSVLSLGLVVCVNALSKRVTQNSLW